LSKITIANIFEISKALATKSGAELQEPLNFLSDFGEQALGALRAGLTFRDNFDGEFKTVDLPHDTEQIVSVSKSPVDIWVTRTISSTSFVSSFGWFINADAKLIVKCTFTDSPADPVTTRLAIIF
jgi:hypothetical protein